MVRPQKKKNVCVLFVVNVNETNTYARSKCYICPADTVPRRHQRCVGGLDLLRAQTPKQPKLQLKARALSRVHELLQRACLSDDELARFPDRPPLGDALVELFALLKIDSMGPFALLLRFFCRELGLLMTRVLISKAARVKRVELVNACDDFTSVAKFAVRHAFVLMLELREHDDRFTQIIVALLTHTKKYLDKCPDARKWVPKRALAVQREREACQNKQWQAWFGRAC
jgi:hypothetical protein